MKKTKTYLDTSVINFLFADDAPEKKAATVDFFERYVRTKVYDAFISPVVIDEINRTRNDDKRNAQRTLGTLLPTLHFRSNPPKRSSFTCFIHNH